jgi:hypothetical protein
MATSFDMGLLGDLFGGGGETGLEGYLTPAQQQAMQRQGLLQAAMAIGQASGPSTTPRSLMQILSSGVAAGQQGYSEAQKNAITQLLTRQKLDEAKRAQASQEAYQRYLMGGAQPTEGMEITPQQAISAPGMPVGPTVDRAAMIGQPAPSVMPSGISTLTREQRAMLSTLPAEKGIPEMLKLTQPSEKARLLAELGMKPTLENLRLLDKPEADPEKIRYLKALNLPITLDNFRKLDKPEALPSEIQILQATGTPVTFDNVQALRRSSATKVDITQSAAKSGVELAYDNAIKDLGVSRDMARSANTTLANIDRILPALDTAIVGPAADTRTTLLRIGKQLNIGGANADEVLKNTAVVVQGLAQQELAAAEQMRGQGTLTDSERAILRRAAGGDQSLTAGELRVGLLAAQRTSRMRSESHGQLLQKAVTAIPELSRIAPMYEVQPYGAPQSNPLQNLIQQELDRRRSQGGRR